MIEKIYKNKFAVTCDNCGEGEEVDSWQNAMNFLEEEEWKKRLIDGEWKHYCKDCKS